MRHDKRKTKKDKKRLDGGDKTISLDWTGDEKRQNEKRRDESSLVKKIKNKNNNNTQKNDK